MEDMFPVPRSTKIFTVGGTHLIQKTDESCSFRAFQRHDFWYYTKRELTPLHPELVEKMVAAQAYQEV